MVTDGPTEHLPAIDELVERSRVVSIPLAVRFRGVDRREALLIEGPCAWGEFAPFLEYPPAEASRWLAGALEAAFTGWPEPQRDSIAVNATVPAVGPERVAEVLARYDGCGTVKVKVAEHGQTLRDDLARVAEVRRVAGRGARVRVDANGGWSVGDARAAIDALRHYDLEYAEQPCATVEELAELRITLARNGIDVPIAADESIRKASDPLRVARLGAADLVVVKVAPLGGVRAALRIVEQCGLPAVVSSALDTSVGIAAGVALAAGLPRLDHACGLGTVALLTGDVAAPSLRPRSGALPVGPVAVDRELVERWAATPDRVAWWHRRLRDAHAALVG